MKIITIVGARPQFIKAATVSRAITEYNDSLSTQSVSGQPRSRRAFNEIILHTGQHFDKNMSQVFFEELEIPKPQYNLGIGGGTHGMNTGRMIEATESMLLHEKPDCVLVYGDTDSTLAGTLAAVKLHIPVAHVEAGLRSYNRRMPEEINRVLTDHASNILFAPTETAVDNLCKEGIDAQRIHKVGDVMYDAALFYASKANDKSNILEQLHVQPKKFTLATVHRAENTDEPDKLKAIMTALNSISTETQVVLPLHPRTRKKLDRIHFSPHPSLIITEPVGYLDMVMLEKNAVVIATDSGGVQKEAFFHKVPCLTLRTETEWVELVELGWNRLAKPDSTDDIIQGFSKSLRAAPVMDENPYGNGNSARQILDILMDMKSAT